MRSLDRTGNENGKAKITGVAVDGERAARRAWAARCLHLVDEAGNELGQVRINVDPHGQGYLDITIDKRIRVHLSQDQYYFPAEPTTNNNDAAILKTAEAEAAKKKADLAAQGKEITDSQALEIALGLPSYYFDHIKHGYIDEPLATYKIAAERER